ncbi:MAG: UTP-glucose-1-phosphate uridylyltransferase [Candidatus Peregrinibacteria bacterium GW2011_GWA2_47_7]|nr:MAG: UTP-glucose-1-phosphate uridylyltransferase [Candidatus Peregrinibacteria bacterium GW2011_GWA2_47_7]
MKHKIRKAVLPVAGFGTRFLPATKAQPKEMLPLVDKPVIQYLVEEAVASGIEEIIIITGRGKRAIEDHFDYSYELEETLVERGKHELLKEVRKISDMARFVYVRQPRPLGDGHAILCARDLIGDEPFAVLFGDDIIDSRKPALKQLMEVYEDTHAPVIALTTVPREEVSQYGIVKMETRDGCRHRITELVEKPSPHTAPSRSAIIGKYIITPEVLSALAEVKPGKDGEVRLIDGLKRALKKIPLYGVEIEGERYDCGDKLGFLKATIHFALKRKDIGPALKKHLKGLDFK